VENIGANYEKEGKIEMNKIVLKNKDKISIPLTESTE